MDKKKGSTEMKRTGVGKGLLAGTIVTGVLGVGLAITAWLLVLPQSSLLETVTWIMGLGLAVVVTGLMIASAVVVARGL